VINDGVLTDKVIILSKSITGGIWKSKTKYCNKMDNYLLLEQLYFRQETLTVHLNRLKDAFCYSSYSWRGNKMGLLSLKYSLVFLPQFNNTVSKKF